MLHCRQGVLFSVCFVLPLSDIPLIHWPKKFQLCFIAQQRRIPKPYWLIYIIFSKLELTFLVLWISSGARLGVWARSPSAFSMCLTEETETSVPAATKSCCRCFADSRGFLTTCLLRTLVAATDSLLFLSRPGSVATITLTFNLQTTLPTVSLGTFSAFALSIFFLVCARQ